MPRQYPITIATFADLLREGHTVYVRCPKCDKSRTADIAAIVEAGRGDEPYTNRVWRCQECGGKSRTVSVEPTGAPGWVRGYPG